MISFFRSHFQQARITRLVNAQLILQGVSQLPLVNYAELEKICFAEAMVKNLRENRPDFFQGSKEERPSDVGAAIHIFSSLMATGISVKAFLHPTSQTDSKERTRMDNYRGFLLCLFDLVSSVETAFLSQTLSKIDKVLVSLAIDRMGEVLKIIELEQWHDLKLREPEIYQKFSRLKG
jgi:hypothetical protein